MIALAHMGGPRRRASRRLRRDWSAEVPDLHTLAVECVAGPDAVWWPRTPGLPDDAFEHDGKLTKREFRALALAKLMPHPGALLWDIGAGCGSVAIEWMRAARPRAGHRDRADPERRAMIARNAAALGVPALDIRDAQRAGGARRTCPRPTRSSSAAGCRSRRSTLRASAEARRAAGRPCGDAGKRGAAPRRLCAASAASWCASTASHAEPLGGFSGWRPLMPVTQWAWRKP